MTVHWNRVRSIAIVKIASGKILLGAKRGLSLLANKLMQKLDVIYPNRHSSRVWMARPFGRLMSWFGCGGVGPRWTSSWCRRGRRTVSATQPLCTAIPAIKQRRLSSVAQLLVTHDFPIRRYAEYRRQSDHNQQNRVHNERHH